METCSGSEVYFVNGNIISNSSSEKSHIVIVDIKSPDSGFFKLNGVASLIFLSFDGKKTISNIHEKLCSDLKGRVTLEEFVVETPKLIENLLSNNIISKRI